MKKALLLFAWILHGSNMAGQTQPSELDYLPFAQDGKTWETQVGGILENIYGNTIDGDTVINGEKWKKVYNYVGFPEFNKMYYAAIRDENKKVYAIAKGSSRPRLLYDFGLKVGDMVMCGVEGNAFGCLLEKDERPDTLLGFQFVAYLKVERIDTIKSHGLEYRCFILTLLDAYREYIRNGEGIMTNIAIWVEGIGSGAGPFLPWQPLPPRGSCFQSCMIDKTYIFGYSGFYDIAVPALVSTPHYTKHEDCHPFDLSGRRLSAPPSKGVYIENGHKWVARGR